MSDQPTPDNRLITGGALPVLRDMPTSSASCCVTSPPYWRQRDYGCGAEEIGREETPQLYVEAIVSVAKEIRRVLDPKGSLWLNVGDKYAVSGNGWGKRADSRPGKKGGTLEHRYRTPPPGYKPKDLTLVAWLLADALRADGWYLRQAIIWDKGRGVEPKLADRPSTGHEYVFLLTPSRKNDVHDPGEFWWGHSVWRIPPGRAKGNLHPAPMPPELARRCILAGSLPGQTVLDPFAGSATTGAVAIEQGRSFVGVELDPESAEEGRGSLREAEQEFLSQLPLEEAA